LGRRAAKSIGVQRTRSYGAKLNEILSGHVHVLATQNEVSMVDLMAG
jgi:hypothetical protein